MVQNFLCYHFLPKINYLKCFKHIRSIFGDFGGHFGDLWHFSSSLSRNGLFKGKTENSKISLFCFGDGFNDLPWYKYSYVEDFGPINLYVFYQKVHFWDLFWFSRWRQSNWERSREIGILGQNQLLCLISLGFRPKNAKFWSKTPTLKFNFIFGDFSPLKRGHFCDHKCHHRQLPEVFIEK